MRFAIFTHVLHLPNEGEYSAYAPYILEMNVWLQQVDEVEIVAPLTIAIGTKGEKNLKGLPYRHSNLTFTAIPTFDLLKLASIFKAVFKIPSILLRILGAMRRADHLHLRSPGNIGLLSAICQIFFPHKPKTAKYAGNWDPVAKQPWTYKLQKWILSNTFLTRNMTVLVYGDWPGQSKNILPFFTASFSESEIEKTGKHLRVPFKFLYVGNLVPGKRPLFTVSLVDALIKQNIPAELHIYGDGELMDVLRKQTGNKAYIHLHGNQPLDVLKEAYKHSHFLILASKSEGWPKAVAEGMFFGCIPVVTPISCVPWMINYGSRGILIPEVTLERGKRKVGSQDGLKKVESLDPPLRFGTGGKGKSVSQDGLEGVDTRPNGSFSEVRGRRSEGSQYVLEETVQKIIDLLKNPEEMKRMSIEAQEWSQEYTLEKFEEAIKKLLSPLPITIGTKKGEQKKEL